MKHPHNHMFQTARIIIRGTTGTRIRYVQETFFLHSVHLIYVTKTPDIRPIKTYVRFSYAQHALKAHMENGTDILDRLNASKLTSELAEYMLFYHNLRWCVKPVLINETRDLRTKLVIIVYLINLSDVLDF